MKRGRLKVGFNFVETMLSDGLCLISDGKGGDCLWANVFQLSAFCFFAWKNQKHLHNRHYHTCDIMKMLLVANPFRQLL